MEAILGIPTCDKCGKPMRRNEQVIIIADGHIRGPKCKGLITFWGNNVRYACHLDCWDGIAEDTDC